MMVNWYMLIFIHTVPQCPIILSSLDQASCIHMMDPLSTHITALNVWPQIHKTLWCPQDYFSRLDWLLQSHGRHCPPLIVRSAALKLISAIPSTHACICFHFFLWQNIFSECQDYCCQNWCVFQSCMMNFFFFFTHSQSYSFLLGSLCWSRFSLILRKYTTQNQCKSNINWRYPLQNNCSLINIINYTGFTMVWGILYQEIRCLKMLLCS